MSSGSVPLSEHTPSTRWPRLAAAGVVIAVAAGYAVHQISRVPNALPMKDFVEYWAAAVVNLRHGNPYSGADLLPLQRAATGDPDLTLATMMWNPPWALVLVTPLGLLPAGAAHLLFVAAQVACLVVSAGWLWRVYGGPADRVWAAWLLALFSAPAAFLLWYGQIGGLLLLGLAGFLRFRDTRPAVAGLFAALTAIKPHLLFAFGLVLLLDAATRKGRVAVLTGAAAVLAAAAAAWGLNPDVYRHYSQAGWVGSSDVHFSPKDWYQPLLSYWLRRAVDPDRFWVQFVPMAVAVVGVAGYWLARRRTWDWPAEMPRLVFASVLTAAYGAWIFDLVVLLVPAIAVAARLGGRAAWGPAVLFAGLTAAALLTPQMKELLTGTSSTGLHLFVWFAPMAFGVYLAAGRAGNNLSPQPPLRFGEGAGGRGSSPVVAVPRMPATG